MTTTIVTARLSAHADKADEARRALLALVEEVRREPGCLRYDLHCSPENPSEFLFYEVWESAEALDTHSKAPALTGFRERAAAFFTGPSDVLVWHSQEP